MGCFVRGGKNGMGCFVRGDKNCMGCFVRGGKLMRDVLSGVAKNGMGCFVPGSFVLHSRQTDMQIDRREYWLLKGPDMNFQCKESTLWVWTFDVRMSGLIWVQIF